MAAPIAFDAKLPESPPLYFVSLLIFTAVTLSIGSVLGLLIKNQAKLTMISDDFSSVYYAVGIMFPADLLRMLLRLWEIYVLRHGDID